MAGAKMGISGYLSGIYRRIEEGFYKLMDALEARGIPVYAIINPIEERGIPALPAALALLVVIGALAYGFFFIGTAYDLDITLSITDNAGNALQDVRIAAFDSSGKRLQVSGEEFSNGEHISISRVPIGSEVVLRAGLRGYKDSIFTFRATQKQLEVPLILEKEIVLIVGKLRLVDGINGFDVEDAEVVAELADGSLRECILDDGMFSCPDVIGGEAARISVSADSYEQVDGYEAAFVSGSTLDLMLEPKPIALLGASGLIVRVYDASGMLVPEARIMVYDAATSELVADVVDDDGEFTTAVDRGTVVRLVVSKVGFVAYDSDSEGLERTMRMEEELWQVTLRSGGVKVNVSVADADTSVLIARANVMLFNSNGVLLDAKETQFGGYVEFADLNREAAYYVAASAERYLPSRIEIKPLASEAFTVQIKRSTSSNTAVLRIAVKDFAGHVANDATIRISEVVRGEKLPSGIPVGKTDLRGEFSATAASGREYAIEAVHGIEVGEATASISAPGTAVVNITMGKMPGAVLLNLLDSSGVPLTSGRVLVRSLAGETLLDANLDDGTAVFLAGNNKTVRVIYTNEEGKTYSEEVNVSGVESVDVKISEAALLGLGPAIQFLGIYNSAGEKVEGLTRGKDYYLKFQTDWPAGDYSGGVHVRLGPDFIKHVDEQEVGILGFDAEGATARYGKTYNMLPAPGFEAVDMKNAGSAGQYNKWIELYFKGGNATRIIKARVKAKETGRIQNFEVHYRAWANLGDRVLRTPADAILADAEFVQSRTGLYAETLTETVNIFEAKPECSEQLCASYKFVRADSAEFEAKDFEAVLGERYALEVQLNPDASGNATIRASTSKTNPKLGFMAYMVDSTAEFPDNDKTDTDIEVTNLQLQSGKTTTARLFFKTRAIGDTSITLQVSTQQAVVTKTFSFTIYTARKLAVELAPEFPIIGEDFSISVRDDAGTAVENAVIKIKNPDGRLLETIIGNARSGTGAEGIYSIKNSFDAGVLEIEVIAPRAAPYRRAVEIANAGILVLPDSVKISILKGQERATAAISIENRGNDAIRDITVSIAAKGLPEGMLVEAVPIAAIQPRRKERLMLSASYSGTEEFASGEAELVLHGRILGKFPVVAKTKVSVAYNQPLPDSCLATSKERLVVPLLGNLETRYQDPVYAQLYASQQNFAQYFPGAVPALQPTPQQPAYLPTATAYRNRYSNSTGQVGFTIKNMCSTRLTLKPEVIALGIADPDLRIDVGEITLEPAGNAGDEREVKVVVTNTLFREYQQRAVLNYDIVMRSPQITKAVPLDVIIWNSQFALQVNRNVEVWLSASAADPQPKAIVPLFIRNTGEVDIENMRFAGSPYNRGNVQLSVVPNFTGGVLRRGASVEPPPALIATALRTERATLVDYSFIEVLGDIEGKQVSFGPIYVSSHISPPDCLAVVGEQQFEFKSAKSKGGALSRTVNARNNCAEPVRIVEVQPSKLGTSNNTLSMASQVVLQPAQEGSITLVLSKNEDFERLETAYFKALLVNSARWISSSRFTLDVKLGKFAEPKGAAATGVELSVCGKEQEKKVVSFPVVATTANCDVAYCDAEQLAEFLAKRVSENITEAKRQVSHYNNSTLNTNCNPQQAALGYCLFDRLGVGTKAFYVYLMNDNLSTQLLAETMRKKHEAVLSGYKVDYIASREDFEAGSGVGAGRQVLLTDAFHGCGRYRVRINGAVRVEGSRLLPEYLDVLVDLKPDEEKGAEKTAAAEFTGQCENKIQNILNLLPVDSGLGIQNHMDSWLGVATSEDEKLSSIGKDFAKTLFGKEERFLPSGTALATNRLILRKGNTEGHIVKLEMVRAGEKTQRTIYANIMEAPATAEDVQKEIAKEAGKAIADLKNHVVEGCISENEDYFLIKSAREIGKIRVELWPEAKLKIAANRTVCKDFNVASEVAEGVKVAARIDTDLEGISAPEVRDGEKKLGAEDKVALAEQPARKEFKNAHSLKLCATGDKYLYKARGKEMLISAVSADDPLRKAEPEGRVLVDVCGMHPDKLLGEIGKLKPGETAYTTPVWQGPKEEIELSDLIKAKDSQKKADDAVKIALGEKKPGEEPGKPRDLTRVKGAGVYLLACGAVSGALALVPVFGTMSAVWSIVFDCGIPAMWIASAGFEDIAAIKAARDFLSGIGNSINDYVGGAISKVIDKATEVATGASKRIPGQEFKSLVAEELTQKGATIGGFTSEYRELIDVATPGVSAYSLAYAIEGTKYIDATTARSVSAGIADKVIERISSEQFGRLKIRRMPKAAKDLMKSKLRDEIMNGLKPHYPKTSKLVFLKKETLDSQIESVVQEALKKVSKDEDVIKALFKQTTLDSLTAGKGAEALAKAKKAEFDRLLAADDVKAAFTGRGTTASIGQTVQIPGRPAQIVDSAALYKDVINRKTAELSDAIMSQLDNKLGSEFIDTVGRDSIRAQTEASLLNQLSGANPEPVLDAQGKVVNYVVRLQNEQVEKAALDALDAVKQPLIASEAVPKALQKGVGESVLDGFTKEADDAIKSGGKYKIGASRLSVALKHMFKGLGVGALSNLAGIFAYDWYMKKYAKGEIAETGGLPAISGMAAPQTDEDGDGKKGEELCDGIDNDGDARIDEDCIGKPADIALKKYETYKVEVVDEAGRKKYRIGFVNDMATIPANAKWLEECEGISTERNLGVIELGLSPNANTAPEGIDATAHARQVSNYYSLYGKAIADAARGHNIPEALLVTLGIWKTGLGETRETHIFGCNISDNKFAATEANAECAASALEKSIKAGRSPTEALWIYNDAPNEKTSFNESQLRGIYEKWDSFRAG